MSEVTDLSVISSAHSILEGQHQGAFHALWPSTLQGLQWGGRGLKPLTVTTEAREVLGLLPSHLTGADSLPDSSQHTVLQL